MSLVIQKYEEGGDTKKPHLYKRINDDIDLDALVNDATMELRMKLPQLKESLRAQVQDEFSKIIQGMYDGTFTYKPGGGWTNTVGITNDPKPKGFDALGIAAGIIGDSLRSLSAYTDPASTKKTSKLKDFKEFGSKVWENVIGPSGKVLYFITLDDVVNGKRGQQNRVALLKKELDRFANENSPWADLGASEAQIKEWRDLYNANKSIFDDGRITEKEYLALSKILGGYGDVEKLFTTDSSLGETSSTLTTDTTSGTTDGSSSGSTSSGGSSSTKKTKKVKVKGISLTSTKEYGSTAIKALLSVINSFSKQELFNTVALGITYNNTGTELNGIKQLKNYFLSAYNVLPKFENSYILSVVLERLRSINALGLFKSDSNKYYIPMDNDTYRSKNVGYVYYVGSGAGYILEMSRDSIPYLKNKKTLSKRLGGIMYFKKGTTKKKTTKKKTTKKSSTKKTTSTTETTGKANVTYDSEKYNWVDIIYNSPWFSKTLQTITLDNYDDANSLLNRYFNDKINDKWSDSSLSPRPEVDRYLIDFNNYYGLFLNEGAIEDAINAGTIKRIGATGDNKEGGYHDALSGAMTNLRHLGTEALSNLIPEMNEVLKALGLEAFVNPDTKMINFRPLTNGTPEQAPENTPETPSGPLAVVNEEWLAEKLPEIPNPWISDLVTGSIRAGRLWDSLHTNAKIYETVAPTLRPALKDTYELYSPVTGAFSAMQHKEDQAARTLSAATRQGIADASLLAAKILEAQKLAFDLEDLGFMQDDKEIKRTLEVALSKTEDNVKRRSGVANDNRESIIKNRNLRAQLKASQLRMDHLSRDSFAQETENLISDYTDRLRQRINNFYDDLQSAQAEEWYNEVIAPATKEYADWVRESDDPWPKLEKYNKFKTRARQMANALIYQGMSDRYHLGYTSDYSPEAYKIFRWT